ncbi:hypothetical protein ACFE04_005473 [Oxalis oulophora]
MSSMSSDKVISESTRSEMQFSTPIDESLFMAPMSSDKVIFESTRLEMQSSTPIDETLLMASMSSDNIISESIRSEMQSSTLFDESLVHLIEAIEQMISNAIEELDAQKPPSPTFGEPETVLPIRYVSPENQPNITYVKWKLFKSFELQLPNNCGFHIQNVDKIVSVKGL